MNAHLQIADDKIKPRFNISKGLNENDDSIRYYKEVLHSDNTNIEALACIATNFFYNDQPEVALKFYRRLLQMGILNSELFNNIGLCCFYAQQYDMILSCFDKALSLATQDMQIADVWYNLGHVALGIGDTSLAYQCFRLSLVHNNDSPEAYNNLGILEMAHGRVELVCISQNRNFFNTVNFFFVFFFSRGHFYRVLRVWGLCYLNQTITTPFWPKV